jgi:acetyltransferase EpsM
VTAVQPLLVLGTHHFAPEVFDLVSELPGFRVEGFVENLDQERTSQTIEGLPVYWIDEIARFAETHHAVCALGTTGRGRFVAEAIAAGMRFATVVHPTARVSRRSELGRGSIVSAGAIIATRTRVGDHVIVNRGALIGHDVKVDEFVTIGPGANIAGLCRIGARTYVGAGAIVIDRTTVGAESIVGAGAVVTKDVPANVQVVGVPARIVKEGVVGR